jgi:hypothetical protein
MTFNRLAWVCAALFVLFCVPLAFLEDGNWRNISGGLSLLSLGSFALALAGDGLAKGQIRLTLTPISRATKPRLFWASIAYVAAIGGIVIVGGIWAILFKS